MVNRPDSGVEEGLRPNDPLGASRSAVSTAYEIAKAGGDGAKLLKQLPKLGRKQLEKSMDSLEQRALEHEEKIRHPRVSYRLGSSARLSIRPVLLRSRAAKFTISGSRRTSSRGTCMSTESEQLAGALICLGNVVALLREEGERKAGQYDGLLAYQALSRIKGEAQAFGLPLDDIGLADFEPDSLLVVPLKQAA